VNHKLISYSIETIPPFRRPAIWLLREPNHLIPACYLQKPKWLSETQWQRVLESIEINASPDFLNEDQPND